jgi:dienelactone hydrolase
MEREELTFPSGDGRCAAWLYRPRDVAGDVPCVVMSHGFSLTMRDGLEDYAERFADAGLAVLAFDLRHLGDSPGAPRGRFRVGLQREDWRSAIAFARTQAGIDGERLVLWGFSFANVAVLELAAREPAGIAAVLSVAPFADGLARALATPPAVTAWIVPRALADAAGRHTTIPVTAQPGERAAMTLPGEADGFAAVVAPGSRWRNRISPAVFLTVATIRPVRFAPSLHLPVWVGMGEQDLTVSRKAVERLARCAPQGELHRYPWDHFGPFTGDGPDRVAADQLAFLRRQRLADGVRR